jgi:hypothetical protein
MAISAAPLNPTLRRKGKQRAKRKRLSGKCHQPESGDIRF